MILNLKTMRIKTCIILITVFLMLIWEHPVTAHKTEINKLHIQTTVKSRFAHTVVTCKMENPMLEPKEMMFSFILPENAFVSGFVANVDDKSYISHVENTHEMQEQDASAGIKKTQVVRNGKEFFVNFNVQPHSEITLHLSYEEILRRTDGHYQIVTNIFPGLPVNDLQIEVSAYETSRINSLKVLLLKSGQITGTGSFGIDPKATVKTINSTATTVLLHADAAKQTEWAKILGSDPQHGLAGQYVIQYDLEKQQDGGEFIMSNGYFVHFFGPSNLQPIPKYVVFVLDTSRSMEGNNIQELQHAMHTILEELKEDDYFSLVEFNTNVKTWDLYNYQNNALYPADYFWHSEEPKKSFRDINFPPAYQATKTNIIKAKQAISNFQANSSTNIYSALKTGLYLIGLNREKQKGIQQHILIFLTDGVPAAGITNDETIIDEISDYNSGSRHCSIFAIGLGKEADQDLLQTLAVRNFGVFKHVYEADDTDLQLTNFYKEISSPLMSDISITSPYAKFTTRSNFATYYEGSEIMVAGKCENENSCTEGYTVTGSGREGSLKLKPKAVKQSDSNIERLWALATITDLLEKTSLTKDKNEKKQLWRNMRDMSLKYAYATSPVTGLVVEKPGGSSAVVDLRYGVDDFSYEDLLESTTSRHEPYTPYSFVRSGSSHTVTLPALTLILLTSTLLTTELFKY